MAWLPGDWGKRVEFVANEADVDATLTNIPLMCEVSATAGENDEDITFVFDEIGSNKLKMAITRSDGTTECYVEIRRWDDIAEVGILFFKAPSVSSSVGEKFYLYYDNTHADNTTFVGDPESAAAEIVWDSSHEMVQSMIDKTTSSIGDSTDNDHDGTKTGANQPVEIDGQVYKAQDFEESNDEEIDTGDWGTTGSMTVQAWIKEESTNAGYIMGKMGFGGNQRSWGIAVNGGDEEVIFFIASASNNLIYRLGTTLISTGTWYHIAGVYDASAQTLYIYVNGAREDGTLNGTVPSSQFIANGLPVQIGNRGNGTAYWDGIIDEARVSYTPRGPEWIKACYETQRDHLFDWGAEELETAIVDLIGSLAAVSNTPTSKLEMSRKLFGTSDGQSNVPTALMKVTMSLNKSIISVIAESNVPDALLSMNRKLISVAIAGQSTADGVLEIMAIVELIGSLAAQSVVADNRNLKIDMKLFGTSDGIANVPDALMKVQRELVSVTITGSSNVPDALMKVTKEIVSVTITGNSNVPTTMLSRTRNIVSVPIAGQSDVPDALMKTAMKLFGTSDGQATVSGVLIIVSPGQIVFLIGSLAAVSGASGYLRDAESLPLSINIADPRIFIIPQSDEEELIAKTMNPKVIIVDRK